MDNFVNSQYSMEDLEKFRDENGFIDLSKAGIEFTEYSREEKGNPNRVKNWVDFNGTKALIKGETRLEGEANYGIYSELIVEEIAKQMGVETARYDLIKMQNEEGKEILGVLSESVFDLENERMITLHDIIGDEPVEDNEYIDATSYEFTINKLRETLESGNYEEEMIDEVISDYKKRLLFTLSVLDVDKHTENVAFITGKVDGKDTIRLSPNYDSESALLMDYDTQTIENLLEDYLNLKDAVKVAQPRIGVARTEEEGGLGSYWMDTLEEICEDDDIYDYYEDVIKQEIDMNQVLENVEKKINSPLPENVKLLAKTVYNMRREDMNKVMNGEMLEQASNEKSNENDLLNFFINMGAKQNGIRTGEQLQMGKNMKNDLDRNQGLSIESILKQMADNSRDDK